MMDKRIVKALKSPRFACLAIVHRISPLIKSDELYLKIVYWLSVGKKLNLKEPKTFNEKLQWLKLYNRKPEYTVMVDKVKAKEYVAKLIGEEHIIPTLGVWDSPEEIDFDALPDQFVLKCNHNSGMGMFICRDKSKLDVSKVKRELKKGLKQDYYMTNREWPYKNVPRKIMAEKYMVDESGVELKDYKIFSFNGEPKLIEVDFGRFTHHKRNIYNTNWEQIALEITYPKDDKHLIKRPQSLERMLELSSKLSNKIPFVRTDFYIINGRIYFGELTFFHGSGTERFTPNEWDERLGELIVLPTRIEDIHD